MLKVLPKETASMLTRDGIRLDADIYRPDAEGKFPVLLMRQPYGRAIASTVVYAHPTWYAAQGYIVVIQDVRGRGTSEGEFKLFANETEDGFDSINWAANLPGSNGKVGMYGFSYQGMTQLYAASTNPPALKTICPAMLGSDLYADWAYEGGAFCLQTNLAWALQLATETARLRNDETAYQKLFNASRNLPLFEPIPARPEILENLAPDSFYHDWVKNSQPGEYWQQLSPNLETVDLPMLHIGGWFDTYMRGTLNLYKKIVARSAYRQQLIVGPWSHLPWSRQVGTVDFGTAAASPIDTWQIRWFNHFLKGLDTGLLAEPPISLFEMGSNQWRSFDVWPNNNFKSYYLASTGLANIREDSGTLRETLSEICCQDVFVHDPWRAVPSLGGHATFPPGSFDRSSLDCRADILTYTSEPLTEDLYLAGDVAVEIWCRADTPSFDLCAVLSQVKPNGSVWNFTQGYARVNPGEKTNPLRIELQPTCIKIAKGNALRLSLSAACFPAYAINPGTGAAPSETRLMEMQIITVTVNSGGDSPSQVLLPVLF
ncbi:MAG: CocE/NonD family hydrolase [Oscillatoriaceae bacterium SKW80]|nr:CocE/NonD family hydrolase [Oscillatoriaceae bacterium SKYG93]MCX8122138.1 CocE/NonD family hydrolase [Oscillatoriaceae bacterium SKW80]MDW8454425.1 CocE/NonD family hydrolase [Oscillatoriaceae cyanobacterium SKYGB_i_bin93]HIK29289.1 CocE/NonD family hydrolase [Oscillatoriaceae cyanobacterium M7585_C2015_266]